VIWLDRESRLMQHPQVGHQHYLPHRQRRPRPQRGYGGACSQKINPGRPLGGMRPGGASQRLAAMGIRISIVQRSSHCRECRLVERLTLGGVCSDCLRDVLQPRAHF
jgi:hypothetical protein